MSSYRLKANEFIHLTASEFVSQHTVYKLMNVWSDLKHFGTPEYVNEPLMEAVKLTTEGAVAPVKNQGQCNSYSLWIVSRSIPSVTVNS